MTESCFTRPGWFDLRKLIQYYLLHFLSSCKDLVIWHDAKNNSISRHLSKNNRSLSIEQFKSFPLRYKEKNTAFVNCRPNGTENEEKDMKKTVILILNVIENLISNNKYLSKGMKSYTKPLPLIWRPSCYLDDTVLT